MKRFVVASLLVSSLCAVAAAEPDPEYMCHAADPATKLSVTFRPEVSIHDLAAWVLGFSCKNIVFSSDVAQYATKVTVIAPGKLTPKQAMQLFVDAVEATGLVVVQKPDTIIIKLGPGMPKNCPDAVAQTAPVQSQPAAKTPPDPDDAGISDRELDAGIHATDDTHHQITRALVDKVLANPMGAAKGARVVPAMKNGKPDGFKLYAIRPGSLYARIGLLNGDTLGAINGQTLDSADKALDVYTKIRDAKKLDISIVRSGKPLVLVVTIVDKLPLAF